MPACRCRSVPANTNPPPERTELPWSSLVRLTACLGLAALLHDLAEAGSQVIVATHSPIIASVPGATLLELGEWGIRVAEWSDLDLVGHWRRFLADPAFYYRYLLAE